MYPRQVEGFNLQFRSGARFDTPWYFDLPLLRQRNPVADDGVLALEVIEGYKVVAVDDFDFLGRTALGEDLHGLDGFLVLGEAGSGRVVGEDETVEDEVPVVGDVAEVAAVAVVFLAVCGFGAEPLGKSVVRSRELFTGEALGFTWFAHSHTKPPCKRGYL